MLTVISTVFSDDKVIIQTNSGPVRGKQSETLFDKRPYYAFKGIPYAEPPVNKLRFKVSRLTTKNREFDGRRLFSCHKILVSVQF